MLIGERYTLNRASAMYSSLRKVVEACCHKNIVILAHVRCFFLLKKQHAFVQEKLYVTSQEGSVSRLLLVIASTLVERWVTTQKHLNDMRGP